MTTSPPRNGPRRSREGPAFPMRGLFHAWIVLCLNCGASLAYHRQPCTRQAATEFSLPDCYLPDLNQELLLSQASFVLSHDAATGYIHLGISKTGLSSFYSKTQAGGLYQQLNNGARALDLRPYLLTNGTAVFHHGAIRVPVTVPSALQEVVQWASDNPSELVLVFLSHYEYENSNQYQDDPYALSTALSTILSDIDVAFYDCQDIYEWTVGDAMDASTVATGGHVLALGRQDDFYGSFCGKENWIEDSLVTCWPMNNRTSCKQNGSEQWSQLQTYVLASANNEATDDNSQLGPPASLDLYPFNEIQALWQVDAHAIAMGLAHFSSILEDNRESKLNENMVDLIYDQELSSVSLLAIDNVHLHGNALLSVLRHTCGQSTLDKCGTAVPIPPMRRWRIRRSDVFSVLLLSYTAALSILFFARRPKLVSTLWARIRGQGNAAENSVELNAKKQQLLS